MLLRAGLIAIFNGTEQSEVCLHVFNEFKCNSVVPTVRPLADNSLCNAFSLLFWSLFCKWVGVVVFCLWCGFCGMLQCLVSGLTNIVFLLQFPKTELLNVSLNSQSIDFNFNL